jgi:hypothetical protein
MDLTAFRCQLNGITDVDLHRINQSNKNVQKSSDWLMRLITWIQATIRYHAKMQLSSGSVNK